MAYAQGSRESLRRLKELLVSYAVLLLTDTQVTQGCVLSARAQKRERESGWAHMEAPRHAGARMVWASCCCG